MLYRILVACLLVSASALQVGPTAVSGRRAALAKAASLAATAVPLAAFAELKQASDADVYARADSGKLNAARVIQRAKDGELVDGSSATCSELDKLIAVDQDALEFEKEKLEAMGGNDPAQKKIVADVEKKIEAQVKKLKELKKTKGCAGLKKAGDADVYTRADEGKLSSARAIERAKTGDLVDGSSATCSELEKIISVDKKALAYEKDKLEAMGGKDPAQAKVVKDVSAKLEAQLKKLEGKKKEKACVF
jgi:predicted transcriptional regulator